MGGALREKAIAWLMKVNGQTAEEIGRNLQHGEVESLTALLESVERQAQADQFVGTGPYHSLIADNMLHERRRIVAWLRAGRGSSVLLTRGAMADAIEKGEHERASTIEPAG
jgi:hypothetical protein